MSMDESIHTEASRDSDVCYSLNVLPFRVADEVHLSPEVELPLGRCDWGFAKVWVKDLSSIKVITWYMVVF